MSLLPKPRRKRVLGKIRTRTFAVSKLLFYSFVLPQALPPRSLPSIEMDHPVAPLYESCPLPFAFPVSPPFPGLPPQPLARSSGEATRLLMDSTNSRRALNPRHATLATQTAHATSLSPPRPHATRSAPSIAVTEKAHAALTIQRVYRSFHARVKFWGPGGVGFVYMVLKVQCAMRSLPFRTPLRRRRCGSAGHALGVSWLVARSCVGSMLAISTLPHSSPHCITGELSTKLVLPPKLTCPCAAGTKVGRGPGVSGFALWKRLLARCRRSIGAASVRALRHLRRENRGTA
jgi:hypothetical protein